MLHFVLLKANIKLEFYDVTTLIFNFTILKLELSWDATSGYNKLHEPLFNIFFYNAEFGGTQRIG